MKRSKIGRKIVERRVFVQGLLVLAGVAISRKAAAQRRAPPDFIYRRPPGPELPPNRFDQEVEKLIRQYEVEIKEYCQDQRDIGVKLSDCYQEVLEMARDEVRSRQ